MMILRPNARVLSVPLVPRSDRCCILCSLSKSGIVPGGRVVSMTYRVVVDVLIGVVWCGDVTLVADKFGRSMVGF
jgi:hypothetical protein